MSQLQIFAPQQNWRKQIVDRLGAGTAALATNATDGFAYIPTCAGAPTGVPVTKTGLAPLIIDTTDNALYFYSSGAWHLAGGTVAGSAAVTFTSGSTFLDATVFTIGASVTAFSVFFWAQGNNNGTVNLLLQDTMGDQVAAIGTSGGSSLFLFGALVAGATGGFSYAPPETFDLTTWTPVLASFDFSDVSAVKFAAYAFDTLLTGTPSSGGSNGPMDNNGGEWQAGVTTSGAALNLSTFWWAPISLLDGTGMAISSANRRMFTDAGNNWLAPSGFPGGGVMLFDGNDTTYATNQLGGGAFTVMGTALTNAPTSPP